MKIFTEGSTQAYLSKAKAEENKSHIQNLTRASHLDNLCRKAKTETGGQDS